LKVGNVEVPDKKILIFGFEGCNHEHIEKFHEFLREAIKNQTYLVVNMKFTKVAETDKYVIINGTST
jgi:hypothetical protein